MGLWDKVTQFLAIEGMQERSLDRVDAIKGFEAVWPNRRGTWRSAGLMEALSIPAIFRSVQIISNTIAMLSLDGFRNGVRLEPTARPQLLVRPNPLTTPGSFFQRTGYYMASRGEGWWWIAKRDADGAASALVPVHPREVTVRDNDADLRYPIIEWRGKRMRNDPDQQDMRQLILFPDESGLRGVGPLQLCGAAVSVAVEAQEWAANFFAKGGFPNVTMHDASGQLSEEEAERFKQRWTDRPPNTPYFYSGDMELQQFDVNEQGAQMLNARLHNNGEAALMFGIPGTLLEHGVQGGSITYQNVTGEFEKLIRACLLPNYLEPIEQAMSDLLTRSTVGRFNIDGFLRPDPLTRHQIYELAVSKSGVMTVEEARQAEGLDPGDIERAPVPFAAPAAIPEPMQSRSLRELRCSCGWLAGKVGGPAEIKCRRCGEMVVAAAA